MVTAALVPLARKSRDKLTVAEVCEDLQIAQSTFYEWRTKELPHAASNHPTVRGRPPALPPAYPRPETPLQVVAFSRDADGLESVTTAAVDPARGRRPLLGVGPRRLTVPSAARQ